MSEIRERGVADMGGTGLDLTLRNCDHDTGYAVWIRIEAEETDTWRFFLDPGQSIHRSGLPTGDRFEVVATSRRGTTARNDIVAARPGRIHVGVGHGTPTFALR